MHCALFLRYLLACVKPCSLAFRNLGVSCVHNCVRSSADHFKTRLASESKAVCGSKHEFRGGLKAAHCECCCLRHDVRGQRPYYMTDVSRSVHNFARASCRQARKLSPATVILPSQDFAMITSQELVVVHLPMCEEINGTERASVRAVCRKSECKTFVFLEGTHTSEKLRPCNKLSVAIYQLFYRCIKVVELGMLLENECDSHSRVRLALCQTGSVQFSKAFEGKSRMFRFAAAS
jgi:hypothetical protein